MGFQSKTYSLSDEVVTAIETARKVRGLTPNKFILHLLAFEQSMTTKRGDLRIEDFPPLNINDAVRREREARGPRPKGDKAR